MVSLKFASSSPNQREDGEGVRAPMPPSVEFRFLQSSPYAQPSEIQVAARDAVLASKRRSGIVIAPCGSGKTALLIELAMKLAAQSPQSGETQRVLFLCYESQGVLQLAEALRQHTTLGDKQVCVQTGRQKDVVKSKFCFMVTTYAMFSASGNGRSEASRQARAYVEETAFDVVLCDEVHHACAPTYRPFLEMLLLKARHVLGFTATLYRNDSVAEETRKEHERRLFGWFGPVLYRATAAELERAGLVAKIRRAEVRVRLTPQFATAYAAVQGTEKQYLAALNPRKLNAVACLCGMHAAMDHAGIVFATHLLTAKVLRGVLGEGWEVLSGSNAHGQEEAHTAEANQKIVRRFNAGELRGIISTAVGESSLDLHCERFRYVVVFDADGGSASAAQKLGRAARTPRIAPKPGETREQLRARRVKAQKSAAYYEINTRGTADIASSKRRLTEFNAEGYPQTVRIAYEHLLEWAEEEEFALPHDGTLLRDMELLKEVMTYDALKDSMVLAKAAAVVVKAPQKMLIKKNVEASTNAGTKVMRDLAKARQERLRKEQAIVDARASQAKECVLKAAQLPAHAVRLFASLNLPLAVQEALSIDNQVLMQPSDDEED